MVEYTQYLCSELGDRTRDYDFGQIYLGDSREIRSRLKNESPSLVRWSASVRAGQLNPGTMLLNKFQTPLEVGKE
jgi:hypothetical protein